MAALLVITILLPIATFAQDTKVYDQDQLAGRLEMRAPGVGYAVERRESFVHKNGYELIG